MEQHDNKIVGKKYHRGWIDFTLPELLLIILLGVISLNIAHRLGLL